MGLESLSERMSRFFGMLLSRNVPVLPVLNPLKEFIPFPIFWNGSFFSAWRFEIYERGRGEPFDGAILLLIPFTYRRGVGVAETECRRLQIVPEIVLDIIFAGIICT